MVQQTMKSERDPALAQRPTVCLQVLYWYCAIVPTDARNSGLRYPWWVRRSVVLIHLVRRMSSELLCGTSQSLCATCGAVSVPHRRPRHAPNTSLHTIINSFASHGTFIHSVCKHVSGVTPVQGTNSPCMECPTGHQQNRNKARLQWRLGLYGTDGLPNGFGVNGRINW